MRKTIAIIFAIALSFSAFAQQQPHDTLFIHTNNPQFIHEFATAEIDSIIFYRTQPRMELPRDTVRDTVIEIQWDTVRDTVIEIQWDTVRDTIIEIRWDTIIDTITDTVIVVERDTILIRDTIFATLGITLDQTAATLTLGSTLTLIPTILPAHATNRTIIWLSSDPDVATVNNDGVVTAISVGDATITARTEDGNFTATAEISVVLDLIFAEDFGTGATQTFGPQSNNWPWISQWDGWNTTGSSATTIQYSGTTSASVRSNAVSSFPGASGGNNVFFAGGGGTFTINGIVPGDNRSFYLSFGTNQTSTIMSVSFSINDGATWTLIPFTKTTTAWGLVETEFSIPTTVSYLSLRFTGSSETPSTGARIDDIRLIGAGQVVEPDAYLIVAPESLEFDRSPDQATITINSDIDWIITSSANWVTLSETSGSGDGTVGIFVTRNTTGATRIATLTVGGSGVSDEIVTITQSIDGEQVLIFRETFGNPQSGVPGGSGAANWPFIEQFNGWNRTGVGISNVTYSREGGVDVRTTVTSPPPFSGQGNVFFAGASGANRDFIISGIAPGDITNFDLLFASQAASAELSLWYCVDDGTNWTGIFYAKSTGDWGLVETGFSISEPTTNLSLRFRLPQGISGELRIDDIELRERISVDPISISGYTAISNPAQTVRFRVETALSWVAEITSGSTFANIVSPTSGTGNGFIDVAFQERNPDSDIRQITLQVAALDSDEVASIALTQGQIFGNPSRYVPFRLELPVVRDSTWFILHEVDGVVNFALEYDTAQRHAFWVAYQLTAEHLLSDIDRESFTFDPRIPMELQPHQRRNNLFIVPNFFPSPYGYERGHIMASADRSACQIANNQSNFMSNISPHLPEFHGFIPGQGANSRGIWLHLEHQIRTWARRSDIDRLYVVKGGSIVPGAEGTQIAEVIDSRNRAVVPRWHFKAIVQRRGDSFYGIAFWLEQSRGMARRAPTQADARTIRELEQLTGIDFFPNLRIYGEQIGQPNLENTVEDTPINWSRWPGINN